MINMSRNLILCAAFGLLVSTSCIHCSIPLAPYYRTGQSYESVYGTYAPGVPAPPGYVEIMKGVFNKKYHDLQASFSDLNKFNEGLEKLFTFRFLAKNYDAQLVEFKVISQPDVDCVTVPEYVDNCGLVFKDLVVYGYPKFKKGEKVELTHDGLESDSEFQVTARYNTDNMIVTGFFCIGESKYYFMYQLNSPSLWLNLRLKRNPFEFILAKRALSFKKEYYVHNYDSSYENFVDIDGKFKQAVEKGLLPHVLHHLSQVHTEDLDYQLVKKELEFVQKYEKLILSSLVQSGIEYVQAKLKEPGATDIVVAEPININLDIGTPGAPWPVSQKAYDIKLKGFMNYIDEPMYVFGNSSLSYDALFYNMSQGVKFQYAEDGDKVAIITYIYNNGKKDIHKKLKVSCITIVSEYFGDCKSKPVKVFRNTEGYFHKTGFLVKIETYDGDPMYEYVNIHIGKYIAKAIHEAVEKSACR